MSCFDSFITLERSTPSRSGLYANILPGVDLSLFEALAKEDQADYQECFDDIYERARVNLISDIQDKVQSKFYADLKLDSHETSVFEADANSNSGYAGVQLKFTLPRYARLHIISVGIFSEAVYASPEFVFKVFDTDQNGEELSSKSAEVVIGRNTINLDEDFEVDTVFIGYNASTYSLRETSNRRRGNTVYTAFDKLSCTFPCYGGAVSAGIYQINGGGLDVTYNIVCSIEKFVCQNINLFKEAFWWKLGQEIAVERRFGERLSRYTTMTKERAEELTAFYQSQYEQKLDNSVKSQSILEDDVCFACKSAVGASTLLP